MRSMTKEDEFFIDDEGWVVVEDPQHGHCCRLHKATETDRQAYRDKILTPAGQELFKGKL